MTNFNFRSNSGWMGTTNGSIQTTEAWAVESRSTEAGGVENSDPSHPSTISRRKCLALISASGVAATGIAATLGRFSHAGLFSANNQKKKASKYIDIHTHIGKTWNGNKELTPNGLLEWMDKHDVEKSVLLPLTSPESSSFLLLTEPALKAGKDHPDRFIPFCSIDPRTSVRGGLRGFVDIIERWVDQGAKGFGEHKVGLDFDDPLMMQIYAACEKVGIPLLFHMDTQRGKDQPGLPRLEHALATFPKLNFIGHGPGWWASISGDVKTVGGYPKGEIKQGGAIDRLMKKYSNIYGDLSAGSGANSISRDKKFGREFLVRQQDRLLFGTDYLQPGQKVPQFDLFESLDLPKKAKEKIYRNNAKKVLGL